MTQWPRSWSQVLVILRKCGHQDLTALAEKMKDENSNIQECYTICYVMYIQYVICSYYYVHMNRDVGIAGTAVISLISI